MPRTRLGDNTDLFAADSELLTSEVALAHRPFLVALIIVGWMGIGFVGAVVMARRGHDFRPLAGLAVVFGPLFAGFVVANLRPRERGTHAVSIRPSVDLGGDQRVAILVIGDMSGISSAHEFLTESPGTIGQVEVIRPISYETADGSGDRSARDRAVADLNAAGAHLADYQPGLTLLPGTTARAMSEHIDVTAPSLVLVVGDPSLESKLDHRTGDRVRVLSVPASSIN